MLFVPGIEEMRGRLDPTSLGCPRVLYINGDSHAAGAEAVVPYAFAEDDPYEFPPPDRRPHPENELVSFGNVLAEKLGMIAFNNSESASSNDRIIRTTRRWLDAHDEKPGLVLIGWSTWEREEWLGPNGHTYYQVNSSGTDMLPPNLRDKYKQWIIEQAGKAVENEYKWHQKIHDFHLELSRKSITHLFFNTYQYFSNIVANNKPQFNDWGESYIGAYREDETYFHWLIKQGFKTVNPSNYHFGASAHKAWANYLELYLKRGGNHI